MELKLQSILFPDKEEYTDNADLFYKGGLGIRDAEEKCFVFSKYSTCDFGAYLNAFSMKKWKKHTKIGKTMLKLEIKGDFELVLSGYHRIENSAKRNVLLKKEYHCDQKAEIIVEIPSNKDTLIAFELRMYSECCVYGGGYYAEVNESDFNEVRLSIATTTFKKEDFIRKNVKMIKDEILTQDDIIGKNVYLHIVDNDEGRVLSAEEFEGPHIYYHRNKNVGGSGGFTRGMIESIRQKPKATHVLLMDDDVVVLSESIKRTYLLLLLAKEKYKDYIISGAMLCYEEMDVFHEDVGFLGADGGQNSSKGHGKIVEMAEMLQKEEAKTKKADSYAGWWYCCVPVTHKVTLGEIVDLLQEFKQQPVSLLMPEMPEGSFAKKLFSLYLTYLPTEKFKYQLKMNEDSRGSFTELIHTVNCGQVSINISKPGITKGQHWHNSKWEQFIVVSGHGLIQERNINTGEKIEFEVSGDQIEAVYMIPGWSHNIINLSETENLITVMTCNEIFDPGHPDTFFEPV